MGNIVAGHAFRSVFHLPRKLVCIPEPSPPPHQQYFYPTPLPPSEETDYSTSNGSNQSFFPPEPAPGEPPCLWSTGPIMSKEQLDQALSQELRSTDGVDEKKRQSKTMSIDMV